MSNPFPVEPFRVPFIYALNHWILSGSMLGPVGWRNQGGSSFSESARGVWVAEKGITRKVTTGNQLATYAVNQWITFLPFRWQPRESLFEAGYPQG